LRRFASLGLAAAALTLAAAAPKPATPAEAERAVLAALAGAADAPRQAAALAALAWPAEGSRDPAIAARARKELVSFGTHGVPALGNAIPKVQSRYQAEVVASLIEARQHFDGPLPAEYVPALETALWFGTSEAKLLAFEEVGRLRFQGAVLPIVDAAIEDPEILGKAIETLGTIGDDRARFFLAEQLHKGAPAHRELAAIAMARIGGRALDPLRGAMRSENRELRELAARAILPVATEADLSELYEYLAAHPQDDPALLRGLRGTAQELERLLEMKRQAEAADSPQDF
jgi:hypothetical protein